MIAERVVNALRLRLAAADQERLRRRYTENAAAWGSLPELADFQHVGELKPGAETLLEADIGGQTEPLFVQQRYGLGNVMVLATGGTWRWQMQLPHEDQRHETFWRQLLQAAATTAPQPVTLTADRVFYGDESTVELRAEVRDKTFKPAGEATVSVEVSGELGDVPSGLALNAYRIVQEALTNVRRHGGVVHRVKVSVVRANGSLTVEVDDDGRGAATTPSINEGFGIVGMRERVAAFDGRLSAGPRVGGGWRVRAVFPVPAE